MGNGKRVTRSHCTEPEGWAKTVSWAQKIPVALAERKLLPIWERHSITEQNNSALESVYKSYNTCSKTLFLGEQLWPGAVHSEPLCPSATVTHGRTLPSAGTFWYLLCIRRTNSHSDHGLLENKRMPFTSGHLPLRIPGSLILKQCFQTQVQSQGPWVQMLTYYLLVKRLGHII